ncbi:CCCH zinc finger and SMR domain containing protein [Metarhizium rileyi]|uniref:CCCH zinc finger and SMR domain containing protein n=1 Tax=Metarhizium rileyi (strain RCEF 4871) TaxID=1649241 RepID=A0A167E2K1_METRR|nr:CCCH zinc finger and SMR domain containing protein [Metarhizium rileyi RCEF 4871]
MVSDEHYDLCLPILQDKTLEDEDKTDKLEELLKKETNLTGSSLDNVVLDAMWRFREGGGASASPPPIRSSILRRPSPASWRGSPTPLSGSPRLAVSPLAPPGFIPSTFQRAKSSTASPFSSPRASPRLALATPVIPHSPNLNAYEFASDSSPATEILGDYQSENVEWLVNDDAASGASSSVSTPSILNAAAPEFSSMSSQQIDMSPYDMLRSILGQTRTDEEIEAALSSHGYDLSATIASIMESQSQDGGLQPNSLEEPKSVLIGKSISSDGRPVTPNGQFKGSVICKFYMSTGQCLRADCRFSHDLSNHLCKYWIMGSCLAGDTCVFSHDPSRFINKLSLDDSSSTGKSQGNILLQDMASFPVLQQGGDNFNNFGGAGASLIAAGLNPPQGPRNFSGAESPRLRSRPGSRHQVKDITAAAPAIDDNEAFPCLGSAPSKQGKKHHGKRGGHGHHKENAVPNSLADIVKMSPSPTPSSPRLESRRLGNGNSGANRNGENSAAALAIQSPQHIPWLETGDRANKAYLKARQEAIKHGGLRNKFLQSAAQAWNRNDARAAKALSLRGQSENDLMRKAHREAARELYEHRNRNMSNAAEIYVDLHGLHPEEAVEYLEKTLMDNSKESKPIYAITGTGHHSKNGKDKVGRAIRNFLNEWRYAYREFSVPGDRNSMGGILGIDARSWDKSLAREAAEADDKEEVDILSQGIEIGDGKVRLLVRDPPKGPSGRR